MRNYRDTFTIILYDLLHQCGKYIKLTLQQKQKVLCCTLSSYTYVYRSIYIPKWGYTRILWNQGNNVICFPVRDECTYTQYMCRQDVQLAEEQSGLGRVVTFAITFCRSRKVFSSYPFRLLYMPIQVCVCVMQYLLFVVSTYLLVYNTVTMFACLHTTEVCQYIVCLL